MARASLRTALLGLVAGVLVAAGAWLGFEIATWPDVESLARREPSSTAFIDRYRARAAREGLPPPRQRWVPRERISPHLQQAVVVAEDIDFFSHHGFSREEIEAAIRDTLQEGKPLRGASTLTQQLAKNLWLDPSRRPWRKVKEAILTWQLERHLSKHRILELYLNVVELGPGIYGAEAASQHYFGRPAAELDRERSAALAAALPNPRRWHPGSDSAAYRRLVSRLRRRMERAGWIYRLL